MPPKSLLHINIFNLSRQPRRNKKAHSKYHNKPGNDTNSYLTCYVKNFHTRSILDSLRSII